MRANVHIRPLERRLGDRVLCTIGWVVCIDKRPYRAFYGSTALFMAKSCAERIRQARAQKEKDYDG